MDWSSSSAAGGGSEVQRRLLDLARDLEQSKTLAQRRKCVKTLVDLLRDDGHKYRRALDSASAAAAYDPSLVDWSAMLSLALSAVSDSTGAGGGKRAKTAGPLTELWQQLSYLFEQSERTGHFLNRTLIDGVMSEMMALLQLDSGSGAAGGVAAAAAAAAADKDPLRIQGAISALANILELIFSYAPYVASIKQEQFQDLFALFSNTLVTLSHLTPSELHAPHPTLLTIIRPYSRYPDSFLGLYQAPAAAVNILVQLLAQYPFTTGHASSSRAFLSGHVFPFFLNLFTLRVPDNLLTKLLSSLNCALERSVAWVFLDLFRDFHYKFLYAMMSPGAWPKSATLKNELVRLMNLVMRISHQLPANNPLRIVEELDSAHPLYRILMRELESDQLFTLSGPEGAETVVLDAPTHAFLCLCSHVFLHVLSKPEDNRNKLEEEQQLSEDAAAAGSAAAAGGSASAIATAADSGSGSFSAAAARKRRRVEADASFSSAHLWSAFSSRDITWQRLFNLLRFLYVFATQYPGFFDLHTPSAAHAPATLMSQLLHGLLRSSERTRVEIKLWSLVCLSRLASVCHINGVQLLHPPSSAFLMSFPSSSRDKIALGYSDAATLFAQVTEVLLKRHLSDERGKVAQCALALFTKLACYNLMSAAQLAHLQTVFAELPALRLGAAPSSSLKLSSQMMIKKESLQMSPQASRSMPSSSLLARNSVKLEGSATAVPMSLLLGKECDGVTLRFIVAYLQRFDLQSSGGGGASGGMMPHSSPISSPAALARAPALSVSQLDSLSEEEMLRWMLKFRFDASSQSPAHHSLRTLWSASQWVAIAVAALNQLPLCAGQSCVCLEDGHADEVQLPPPHSRFVHASRPHFTWLKADALGVAVDIHNPSALRDFTQQAQFAPLVSTETTIEEVHMNELPSVCCKQHKTKSNLPTLAETHPLAASTSAARSSSLRLQTLSILSSQIDLLQQTLADRAARSPGAAALADAIDFDTTDHRMDSADEEYKSDAPAAAASSSAAGLRVDDLNHGCRFYLHYIHIMCEFMQRESAVARDDAQQQAALDESRPLFVDLLSTCLKQLAALVPLLLPHIDTLASSTLFAYLRMVLSHFDSVFVQRPSSASASGSASVSSGDKLHMEGPLQQSFGQLQSAVLKIMLSALQAQKRLAAGGAASAKRSLDFDDEVSVSSAAGSSSSAGSSILVSELHANDSLPPSAFPVFDSLLDISRTLLSWRLSPPVNLLADLKVFLDNHMGLKATVRDCGVFYRLALVHSLAKSLVGGPRKNQDLLYYVSYLSEEFSLKPAEDSASSVVSKDLVHFRALGFFLDLAAAVRSREIDIEEGLETERIPKVFEAIFATLNAAKTGVTVGAVHRYSRLLKARAAYEGVMSSLTTSWGLVSHLSLDLAHTDFIVRLFAATQVRKVLTIPQVVTAIYPAYEKRIMTALQEPDKKVAAAAASSKAAAAAARGDALDSKESVCMTLLACLAQMGLSVEKKERTILLHLCHLWRDRPSARPIITLVYQQLSSCLQYHHRAGSSSVQGAAFRARSSSLFPPSSSTTLLDDHLDFVLNEWLQEKSDIADFPRELLMQGAAEAAGNGGSVPLATAFSLEFFLRRYASRILAILVINHDSMGSTLDLLLEACGCDLPALLRNHFATSCARFYAIYSQNTSDNAELVSFYINAATGCLDFLKKAMTEKRFNTYYHSKLADILCALVDLVVMEPSGTKLASYALPNFLTSLSQLAKAEKTDVPHHLCSPSHDRIQTLLLYLRVRIASEFRVFRQWKLFELVRALLLDCIHEFMATPSVWRPIMDLLLWMLPEFDARFPDHAEECVQLLSDVTLKLIQQVAAAPPPEPRRARAAAKSQDGAASSGAAEELAAATAIISVIATIPASEMMLHVRHIFTAMIEYSGASSHAPPSEESKFSLEAPPKGSPASKIALVNQLTLELIRALPVPLHGDLTLLPPFPSHPLLTDINTVLKSLSRDRSLAEEIICFLINVRSSANPKEGSAGLAHLLQQLRAHPTELNQLMQPIPPSLSALGLQLLSQPGLGGKRTSSNLQAASVKNPIIAVDGRNPSSSDSLDASIVDLSMAVRVSNRILSSPDHESSGHWGFDLIAPLIGSLCAFCNWSQSEGSVDAKPRFTGSTVGSSDAARIRMLAVQCLGEIGAVDPSALNGHNSRIFRNANPLPPIGRPMPASAGDAPHPFAAALLAGPSTPTSAAAAAAQLHASWFGRWYAVGGGLQASSCEILASRSKDPASFSNNPHHVLILYLLNHHWRSSNAHVAQNAAHALLNLFCEQKETAHASKSKAAAAGAAAAEAKAAEPADNGAASLPSAHVKAVVAFSQLDSMTQSYLSPFWSAKYKTVRNSHSSRGRQGAEVESEVWDATSRSFDDWICRLTRHLCSKRVKDPVLIHCAGVMQHLPDLATRLFPYILFELMSQGDEALTQMLAMRFNALIASILAAPQLQPSQLASPNSFPTPGPAARNSSSAGSPSAAPSLSSNSRRVLQTLLSAWQYVREQMLIIHRQIVINATKNHPAPVREGTDLVRIIAAVWDGKLDLLKMARAAQACDMYATSLIMLEQWHVRTYDRLNVTSPQDEAQFNQKLAEAAAKQGPRVAVTQSAASPSQGGSSSSGYRLDVVAQADDRALYHSLLLEVCRSVSDPDLVYGALHLQDVLEDDIHSDLITAEHEGNFAKTMQVYDGIFQQTRKTGREQLPTAQTPSAVSLALASSAIDHLPSHAAAHAGLVHSLQRLGCTHLVDRYLHDLSNSDTAAYSVIQDVHFEAAWRTSNWDLQTQSLSTGAAPPTLAEGAANVGLHTCLFHSLRSLHGLTVHQKNSAAFLASVSQARARLVSDLTDARPETTQHVFPAIMHLHLLADVERSWRILDKALVSESMDLSDSLGSAHSGGNGAERRFNEFERLGRDRLFLLTSDFDAIEPILALRGVILQLAHQPSVLATHLRFVAACARQSNRRVVGTHAIREGLSNSEIPVAQRLALKLEEAQLNWSEGLSDSAIRGAKHVVMALQALLPASASAGSSHSASSGSAGSDSAQQTARLLIDASCLVAEWMSRSHSEASHVIHKYLMSASELASSPDNAHSQAQQQHKVHYQLACFFDRTFQSLFSKSQSPEHEASRRLFASNAEKIRSLNESMNEPAVQAVLRNRDTSDDKIVAARAIYNSKMQFLRRLQKEHDVDAQQNAEFDKSLAQALQQSILNYCVCLRHGDLFDTQVVYRLIALWFNHYANEKFTAEKLHIMKQVDSIPSRKFLPLVYQVASRLSLPNAPGITKEQQHFRTSIHDLIKRMILDHPYHALLQVFALAHGDQVSRVSMSVAGGVEMNEHRIKAASDLLAELKREPSLREMVVAQEKLILAYIALGSQKFSRGVDHIPLGNTSLATLRVRDLALVPVPTLTIPVRADCNYKSTGAESAAAPSASSQGASLSASAASIDSPIVTISSFDRTIRLATSGVNVPLILELLCSDGKKHKQLLKSADDLRQDAVMEQVFKLVNELLQSNRHASRRQLHIRTYNVVPLTPGVGLVEWVMNTISLADVLVADRVGAHARHARPGQKRDYRGSLNYLREAHEARALDEYKTRFKSVCDDFQPVFHRFFLEMFPAPAEWLARRTAYTRSVAVNSIVGFVVGLGDRHIHNILVDTHTAELIHIDLGVAFDMGAVLKTPEIVPFRLSRDMVDAMGAVGVEGTFRKGAEESMRVLRDNREMLLTVLEVFLVDPLYKWALSPAKIQQLRPLSEDDEVALSDRAGAVAASASAAAPAAGADAPPADAASVNSGAARAMFNVKQRLAGVAYKDTLSVEGQVNALIHEATDMEKLAKMYYGWSAFV